MADWKKDIQTRMEKTLKDLENEFNSVRTGRASTAIFDKVMVDYYGAPTPLNQIASISIPEARLVVIQPWDKNALGEIEKAIQTSELSLNPNNDGKVIRINIPPLTEDRRKELTKMAKDIAEEHRVALRNIRRDAKDQIKGDEFSEDEAKKAADEIQRITDDYVKNINETLESKEKEIMEI